MPDPVSFKTAVSSVLSHDDVSDPAFRARLDSFLRSDATNPVVQPSDYLTAAETFAEALRSADEHGGPDAKGHLERLKSLWTVLRAHTAPRGPEDEARAKVDAAKMKSLLQKWNRIEAEGK
jgi:hypothetical protein